MNKYILYIFIFLLLALIEASLFPFAFRGHSPALLVAFLIPLLLYQEDLLFFFLACFIAGLCQDIVSFTPFGSYMFAYFITGFILAYFRRLFFNRGMAVYLLLVAIFDLLSQLFILAITFFAGGVISSVFISGLLWHLLLTLIFALVIYPLSLWTQRWVTPKRVAT